MERFFFGSGTMWAVPTLTLAGAAVTNPTPVPFGSMQDVSVDFAQSVKELYGNKKFPIAVAAGTAKITGKCKVAKISAGLFNLVFGETTSTGETKVAFEESGTVPTTPFTVTVANSATWVLDLGVKDVAANTIMTRVASAPATGQYSVSAGVYTFAAADTGKAVKISYTFTASTAPALSFTINNQLLGLQPYFKLVLAQQFQGKYQTLTLNRVCATKLGLSTKLEDFMIPELDFSAMADDSDVIATYSLS